MKRTIILASISVLCLLQTGWGQVPRTISYQGVLKDDAGNLINDSVNLAFSLYDVATGGTVLWSETYLSFTVNNGVFNVILGSSAPLNLDFDAQYWLETTVNGGPLSPRTRLTSSPYSFYALRADTAQYALSAAAGGGAGWSLTGNSIVAGDFLGTTNNQALDFQVNNARALRLEPNAENIPNIIGGYSGNSVTGGIYGATIGGGGQNGNINQVTANFGTVGGGQNNTASSVQSTVAGGQTNTASGNYATVSGGQANTASNNYATVSGGNTSIASGRAATVPGGYYNVAGGGYSFAAGRRAKANHNGAFVWADSSTNADFTSIAPDEFAVRATGGFRFLTSTEGSGLRLEPNTNSPNVIGGYSGNSVTPGIYGATISGGGVNVSVNQVTASYAAIGGGYGNTASGGWATIGGGSSNTAGGTNATVGGGVLNTASGYAANIGGGTNNNASGWYATVPGGSNNTASGQYSFAAGRRAKAKNDGAFVWADGTDADLWSSVEDEFSIRASGGVRFYTNSDLTSGCYLPAGGGSWTQLSDRNVKENLREEDGEEVLAAIATMFIPSWNYKTQDQAIRHLGPIAQDFYAAFGLGEDERYINTLDIDGINLLAIQALDKRTRELKGALQKLDEKTQQIDEQEREIEALQAAVASLEDLVKVAARE